MRQQLIHDLRVSNYLLAATLMMRSYALTATEKSMRSVTAVRHADASVLQAVFYGEFVAAAVVALENPVYGRRRFDLRNTDTVVVRLGKRCLTEHGKSDQPQSAKQQP